ncbi:hypothetical protein SAMN05192561_10676 [Halopenitus malekzadehii]|uniref:Uncharacterized protein n=1 Tax=Halopenitus malekzadehii TaxID=1267564 RepID=A0A1H6J0M5_9EURY|nr:hypothetical protein [Halopenitus malekzadehii]SEH55364.1 hypothetical protein SAMN05192561_10676 [Halopenitus malekzadehii]
MADVTAGSTGDAPTGSASRSDRGQLFLVAAIVLAVLFVTLAVLLNTVIYSGTLATRDAGADVDATIEHHSGATAVGTHLLTAANDHDGSADHDSLRTTVTDGLSAWENASTRHAARRGHVTTVANVSTTDGSRIRYVGADGADERFHPANTTGNWSHDWTLAESVSVRNYTIEADPSESIEPADAPANVTDSFFLVVTAAGGSGDAYALHLYEDDSQSCLVRRNVDGTVDGDADDADLSDPVCVGSETIVVDVTTGTVAPGNDPGNTTAFDNSFFASIGRDHSIAYWNGDAVTGSYDLQVNSTRSNIGSTPSNAYDDVETGDPDNPTIEATIYDVTYDVRYRSETVRYEAPVRIAPGEAPYDDA